MTGADFHSGVCTAIGNYGGLHAWRTSQTLYQTSSIVPLMQTIPNGCCGMRSFGEDSYGGIPLESWYQAASFIDLSDGMQADSR